MVDLEMHGTTMSCKIQNQSVCFFGGPWNYQRRPKPCTANKLRNRGRRSVGVFSSLSVGPSDGGKVCQVRGLGRQRGGAGLGDGFHLPARTAC